MTKLSATLMALVFAAATASPLAFAADDTKAAATTKKPTAEECKKDAKMKGCEEMKKEAEKATK